MFSIIIGLFTEQKKSDFQHVDCAKTGEKTRLSILSSRFHAFDLYLNKA